jgi:6-pyruvoyl-tetrahydropterin synthase
MAKDPAVLLYTQDFLVGTLSMTDEQRGKYIYLLCLQHQKGRLTLVDLKSKLTDEDIEVAEKFPLQADGFYYNQRMCDEAIKRKDYTESRRNNRTGKKNKTSDIDVKKLSKSYVKSYDKSYVNRMENENENENEDANVSKAANKTVSKAANKTVSNSTRKIIKKALDMLIEHGLSKEQYAEAAFNINDIGGLEKTYELLGIRTGDDWTSVILQNSQMYGFNIKEK